MTRLRLSLGCQRCLMWGVSDGGEMLIGSLFAGIGGLERGLEAVIPGARTIWQVEQDPFARRVLAKHWPEADRSITDVREVTKETVQRPDLCCGGFPCQDISTAGGDGSGLDGERSGLWFEFARIIGELRPRYVVLENVSAIRARGMDRVLGDLAALGYGCIWDCIPAAAVGARHVRDRWFCIGWSEEVAHPERNGRLEGSKIPQERKPVAALCGGDGRRGPFRGWIKDSGRWSTQPRLGSLAYGVPKGLPRLGVEAWEDGVPRIVAGKVPDRVSKLRCLGNAVVPQVAEVLGHAINQIETCRTTKEDRPQWRTTQQN